MEIREVLQYSRPGRVIPSDVWEVLRHSGAICPDVWVRDMGVNALHPLGNG